MIPVLVSKGLQSHLLLFHFRAFSHWAPTDPAADRNAGPKERLSHCDVPQRRERTWSLTGGSGPLEASNSALCPFGHENKDTELVLVFGFCSCLAHCKDHIPPFWPPALRPCTAASRCSGLAGSEQPTSHCVSKSESGGQTGGTPT